MEPFLSASDINILMQLENPFDNTYVRNVFEPPVAYHIPDINAPIFETLCPKLTNVYQTGISACVVIKGDAGAGKTHFVATMLERFRKHAYPVFILASAVNERLTHRVLAQVVERMCSIPKGHAELYSPIQNILVHHCLKQGIPCPSNAQNFEERCKNIVCCLEKLGNFSQTVSFARALCGLWESHLYLHALEWLKGTPIDSNANDELKLPNPPNEEMEALQMLQNFCQLLPQSTCFVFIFDQLDDLDTAAHEQAYNFRFIFRFNSLIQTQKICRCMVLINVIPITYNQIKNHIVWAHRERINLELELERISQELALKLIAKRLEPVHSALSKGYNTLFPFTQDEVTKVFSQFLNIEKAYPRDYLHAMQNYWKSRKQNGWKTILEPEELLQSTPISEDTYFSTTYKWWIKWFELLGFTYEHHSMSYNPVTHFRMRGNCDTLEIFVFTIETYHDANEVLKYAEKELENTTQPLHFIFLTNREIPDSWKKTKELATELENKGALLWINVYANNGGEKNLLEWVHLWFKAYENFLNKKPVFSKFVISSEKDFFDCFYAAHNKYRHNINVKLHALLERNITQLNIKTSLEREAKRQYSMNIRESISEEKNGEKLSIPKNEFTNIQIENLILQIVEKYTYINLKSLISLLQRTSVTPLSTYTIKETCADLVNKHKVFWFKNNPATEVIGCAQEVSFSAHAEINLNST